MFIAPFWSCGTPADAGSSDFSFVLAHANAFVLRQLHLIIFRSIDLAITRTNNFLTSKHCRKKVLKALLDITFASLIINSLECLEFGKNYPLNILLILSGDIHTNPGPSTPKDLKFFHWNLNSLCARGGLKNS